MKHKRICIFSVVDISARNGQGIYGLKTIESFLKPGIELTMIVPEPVDKRVLKPFSGKGSVEIRFLPEKRINRSVIWHLKVQVLLLIQLLACRKNDAFVYSLKPMLIAPLIFRLLTKKPFFVFVEGYAGKTVNRVVGAGFRSIARGLLKLNLHAANNVFPAYESAEKWVLDNGIPANKVKVIRCGVDYDIFSESACGNSESADNKRLVVGYVGSFRKVHMLDRLLCAARELPVTIRLMGSGTEFNNVRKSAGELAGSCEVLFEGAVDQQYLPEKVAACDLMWGVTDPDHWGIPIKVYEYLACNKKVIVTHKPDWEFIGEHKFGYLLDVVSVEEIRALLANLVHVYEMDGSLGDINSRDYVNKISDWDRFSESVTSLLP